MTTPVRRVAVALGSNCGERDAFLRAGTDAIRAIPGVTLLAATAIEETTAFGPPQPDYLNQMVLITTGDDLATLLRALQAIEHRHGRERITSKGPRTLDLDIVWADGAPVTTDTLLVPHPGLLDRMFWQRELRALLGAAADEAIRSAQVHAGRDTDDHTVAAARPPLSSPPPASVS